MTRRGNQSGVFAAVAIGVEVGVVEHRRRSVKVGGVFDVRRSVVLRKAIDFERRTKCQRIESSPSSSLMFVALRRFVSSADADAAEHRAVPAERLSRVAAAASSAHGFGGRRRVCCLLGGFPLRSTRRASALTQRQRERILAQVLTLRGHRHRGDVAQAAAAVLAPATVERPERLVSRVALLAAALRSAHARSTERR